MMRWLDEKVTKVTKEKGSFVTWLWEFPRFQLVGPYVLE